MKTSRKEGGSQNKINMFSFLMKQKRYYIPYLITNIVNTVISFAEVWFISQSLAYITAADYNQAILYLGTGLGLMLAWCLIFYGGNLLYYKMYSNVCYSAKTTISGKMLQFSSSTFDFVPSGKMVQRIDGDVDTWFTRLDDAMAYILDLTYKLAILVYICVLNWIIGLIIIAGFILVGILNAIQNKYQKKFDNAESDAKENNISLINETVRGEKDIKSLKLESVIEKKLNKTINEQENAKYKNRVFLDSTFSLNRVFSILTQAAMLLVAIFMLRDGVLAVTLFMFIFTNRDTFVDISYAFANIRSDFTKMKVASTRINELFDDSKFATEKFGTKVLNDCKGKIEFKNVSFSYKQDLDSKKTEPKKILDKVSFTIEPNSTVAFVGRSGSGKTTIMNLIAKMLDADSGKVLLDGVDVQDLTKDSIRNNIAMVNQFSYIFDMTIRENLLMANGQATESELWDALDKASLSEFVKGLPKGIDTKVGEGGVKLSGGQRQRLSIARAFLRNSKIILFDESTSSLDNFAQNDIKHSIDSLSGERTVVIVAHRLSTIKNAEKIFFVKDGKINDIGTFDELFSRNEEFRNMFLVEQI